MDERVRRRRRGMQLLLAAAAAMVVLVAAQVAAEKPEASPDTPVLLGVTPTSMSVLVPCLFNSQCKGMNVTYKEINATNWSRVEETPEEFQNTIGNLKPETEYVVKIQFLFHGRATERELTGKTCQEKIPHLPRKLVRVVKTGPGWLDVRWTPVRDKYCKSNFYYLVQYSAEGSNFTNWETYGVYRRGPRWFFRPTHPCAAWDGEFCLLLTDEVQPGKNHTIRIKPIRYNPINEIFKPSRETPDDVRDAGEPTTVYAVANADEVGAYSLGARDALSPCNSRSTRQYVDRTSDEGRSTKISQTTDTVEVPWWAIILAVVILVATVALIITVRYRMKSASSKSLLPEEPPTGSVPPADTTAYRSSSVYDDCLSANHATPPIPVAASSAKKPEPLYERLQGVPSGMQAALAAAAAAKVSGAAPEPAPVGNHYVSMASGQPVYDDAHGIVRQKEREEISYSNVPANGSRESNVYMEPGSPIYDDAKGVDTRASEMSVGYNRPYSQAKTGLWRGW